MTIHFLPIITPSSLYATPQHRQGQQICKPPNTTRFIQRGSAQRKKSDAAANVLGDSTKENKFHHEGVDVQISIVDELLLSHEKLFHIADYSMQYWPL